MKRFTKKKKLEFLRHKLRNDPRWAVRALVRVYQNQTEGEKCLGQTVEHNGIGFTAWDARPLSHMAKKLLAYRFAKNLPWGFPPLNRDELSKVMIVMPKYRAQVLNFCNPETLHKQMEKHYGVQKQNNSLDGVESPSNRSHVQEKERQDEALHDVPQRCQLLYRFGASEEDPILLRP